MPINFTGIRYPKETKYRVTHLIHEKPVAEPIKEPQTSIMDFSDLALGHLLDSGLVEEIQLCQRD